MNQCARLRAPLALAALIVAGTTNFVRADSLYAPPSCHEVHRAGHPRRIASWARPQHPCAYDGYFVGGGAHALRLKARTRGSDEGTWGWDYVGRYIKPLVRLNWTNPPRYQGGTGSYEPDGPQPCKERHH